MSRSVNEVPHGQVPQVDDRSVIVSALAIAPVGNTLAKLIAERAQFDIIFIDPRHQITMLDEYYVDGSGTLDRCLPIHLVMAPRSVAVVSTRIRHLAVVINELLPRCGFSRIRRIPARRTLFGADLRNAEVIVVAERGGTALPSFDDHEWIKLAVTLDPIEFAEHAYPSAKRRLHAFADSYRPGWMSLPVNSTWIEIPTL